MGRSRKMLIDAILEKMRNSNKTITEKDILELIGMSRTSNLRDILHTPKNPIMRKMHVALLHLVSGLDIDRFLLSKSMEDQAFDNNKHLENDNKLFTRSFRKAVRKYEDETDINISVYHPNKDPKSEGYDILYLNKIRKIFDNCRSSIFVTENLFKGDNSNPGNCLEGYRSAHEEIYKIIESKVKDPLFHYKRVFCLSPSTSIHEKTMELKKDLYGEMKTSKTEEQLRKELSDSFLIECSMETLMHVKRCLIIKEDTGNDNINFSLTPHTRFRHHCLIDNNFLLTEDYSKKENGIVPDQVIIDRIVNNSINDLTKGIFRMMNELEEGSLQIKNYDLTWGKIKKLYDEVDVRIRSRKILLNSYKTISKALHVELANEQNPDNKIPSKIFTSEINRIKRRLENDGVALDNQLINLNFKKEEFAFFSK